MIYSQDFNLLEYFLTHHSKKMQTLKLFHHQTKET